MKSYLKHEVLTISYTMVVFIDELCMWQKAVNIVLPCILYTVIGNYNYYTSVIGSLCPHSCKLCQLEATCILQ